MGDPDLWLRIIHPDDRARAVAENQRHNETGESFSLDYRVYRKDGRLVWIHDEARMVRDERGVPTFSLGVMIDVTEIEARRREGRVPDVSRRADRPPEPRDVRGAAGALDRPREASRGLRRGDLRRHRRLPTGERLARPTRRRRGPERRGRPAPRGDARDGSGGAPLGDTFLLLLADLERDGDDVEAAVARAESAAQRILDSLAVPFRAGGTELYVSASIGISLFPQDGDEPGSLLRNADAAMLESKKGGHALRGLQPGRPRLLGEAPVRDPPAQGGGEPAVDAPLPADPRPRDRPHAGCRGADPVDRARRHDGAARRLHPARRGARSDRSDRRLGGARARVPGAGVARAGHRSLDQLQPLAPTVLAAGPRRTGSSSGSAKGASTRRR